jgi:methionyl-tRNA formyltransferase
MNIIFAGSPYPSAKILDYLTKNSLNKIQAVLTKPDAAKKRGKKVSQSIVSEKAKSLNLCVYKPLELNNPEFKEKLMKLDVDILIVSAYGKILPNWLLELPKIMPVNIHYSLLPKYRGASPIQSSLINGDKYTGVSFMKMNKKLDEGDVLESFKIKIENDHNKNSLEDDLSNLAISKIDQVLKKVYSSNFSLKKQNNDLASYCSKIKKADSLLDFNNTSESILNKYKAYYDWPGVSFVHKKNIIKIAKMHISNHLSDAAPGEIIKFDKSGIHIKTGNGMIVITHLQFPNKNVISSNDAFNAYKDFFAS